MSLLRTARIKSGLTKAEVARRAGGMSKSHYGRIESGETRASYKSAKAIAAVFNREVSEVQIMELRPEAVQV